MKRIYSIVIMVMIVGVLVTGCGKQSNAYEVVSSFASSDSDGCNVNYLTIVMDNCEGMEEVDIANEIIEGYISNSLEGMLFSFDVNGYAKSLIVEVDEYQKESDSCEKSFEIKFIQETMEPVTYSAEIRQLDA